MSDANTNDPGPVLQPEPTQGGAAPKQISPEAKATWGRLFPMLVVAVLGGLGQTVLNVMALIQFIVMLTGKGQPNAQIADFGKRLGGWMDKASKFQTAATEDKPWPWSPLS